MRRYRNSVSLQTGANNSEDGPIILNADLGSRDPLLPAAVAFNESTRRKAKRSQVSPDSPRVRCAKAEGGGNVRAGGRCSLQPVPAGLLPPTGSMIILSIFAHTFTFHINALI